jgi:hypothetical protein
MSNSNLPWILISVEMTLNNTEMKLKMMELVKLMGMSIIDGTIKDNSFHFSKRQKNIIKNFCSTMFNRKGEPSEFQVVIQFVKDKYNRLVEIRSLKGNNYINEFTICSYIKKCIAFSKSMKIERISPGYFINLEAEIAKDFEEKEKNEINKNRQNNLNNSLLNNSQKNIINGTNTYIEENISMLESINKQATSFYEIYKILSQENYSVGKDLAIFINEFKIKNENIEKSYQKLPEQMKEIINMRNKCDNTFSNYFNMGKEFKKSENIQKNSKIAIEKFIFNKVYYQLYDLYKKRYEKENEKYLEKKKIINEKYTIKQIMEYLEIRPKFRCLDEYEAFNESQLCLPFKSTIDYINKIEYEQNPKSKFDTLIEAGLELRNTILGCHGGKNELNSMDDELPIFIYCSTQTNIKNAPAEYHMIEDYLHFASGELDESKVVTNVMSSILFICNGWEIKDNENENENDNEKDNKNGDIIDDDNKDEKDNKE